MSSITSSNDCLVGMRIALADTQKLWDALSQWEPTTDEGKEILEKLKEVREELNQLVEDLS